MELGMDVPISGAKVQNTNKHSEESRLSGRRALSVLGGIGSAESEPDLLVRELLHRIHNDFTSLISTAMCASLNVVEPQARTAIAAIVDAIYAHAHVYRLLQIPECDVIIDVAAYMKDLGIAISRSKLAESGVKLTLAANPAWGSSTQCWKLGMIVTELITNSVRHAFDADCGQIRIELTDLGDHLQCTISDNGAMRSRTNRRGTGLRIIESLVASMGGSIDQNFFSVGASTIVHFPTKCPTSEQRVP
jgi:two-component sensor histidine kinase